MKGICLLLAAVGWTTLLARAETTGVETMGLARFTVITPQLIRMEYASDGKFVDEPSWFAANRNARFTDYEVTRSADSITLDTGVIRLTYQDDEKPFGPENLRAEIKQGKETSTWQAGDASDRNLGGANRTLDGVRHAVPITDGILSRDGWYLLDDSKSVLATNGWFAERPNDKALDWYLFGYGFDYKAALKSLTTISGPVPLPRRYTMGIWYSRYWAYSADDFKQIVDEYHQHNFPLDVLVMDMDWHPIETKVAGVKRAYLNHVWTGYTWNKSLIPDPPGLLRWLHDNGLHVTLNDHPADGIQPHEETYAAFMKAMGKDPNSGETIPFDAGDPHYLDTFWQYSHVPREKEGVDFWWLDWQQFPNTKSLPDVTNLAMLNDFYFKKSQGDGQRGQSFSRWAGWGDQRNPIHFSGDADTGWPMLAFEVPFTSTSGNAGCFFWTHDIGGHMGGRNEESYTRWCQFGALSAALRSHSTRNKEMDRRPWTYPDWAENSMRLSFQLRARLLPYIYSCAAAAAKESVPMIRPMYLEHPEQEAAYHNGQQFYLGDNLLIAPITMPGEGMNHVASQHVWFPEGTWYQYFSGEEYTGPSDVIAAADINEFPLFVRGGVPVPEQPFTERPATAPLTHLVVRCFPGEDGKTGTSTLYEDDGISADYAKGASATTPLFYSRKGDHISIHIAPTEGSYRGQPAARGYTILLPNVTAAKVVSPAGLPVSYDEDSATTRIDMPDTNIRQDVTVEIDAKTVDPGALRERAIARRSHGIPDEAPVPASTEAVFEAIAGRGLVAVNQHPYLLGHDTRLVYVNGDRKQPATGVLRYGKWSAEVPLKSGALLDLKGLIDAVPPNEVVPVWGLERDITLTLGKKGPVLSTLLLPIEEQLGDLALAAEPGASSGDTYGLNDGSAEGYPGAQAHEWVPDRNAPKPDWAQLRWPVAMKIKRVLLYDRPNLDDQVLAGKLTFSDGSTQDVGALPNDGQTPFEIIFPEKEITWVKFEITQTSASTKNAGLAEIAVFDR